MPNTQKTNPFQRIIILLSGLVFLGTTGFTLLGLFTTPSTPPPAKTSQEKQPEITQLKKEEKGYEVVLAREPNNVAALKGLAETRLALEDFPGAIAPLEKLAKIYPQDPNLKALLDVVKEKANPPTPKPNK